MLFRRPSKRAPAPEPTWEERVEIARPLNRAKVSAAPLQRLPLVSIFDDEEYENYDFDLIAPLRRLRIGKELKALGFRQVSGSTFESRQLRKNLQPYQTEGIDLRRRRKFQSRLPS